MRTIYRAFPVIDPATIFRQVREHNPILDAQRFHLYASGRAALYHAAMCLKYSGIQRVYAPEYHCGVEIEALVRAGLIVHFYPLEDNLDCDISWLQSHAIEKGGALLIIHYYGFPQPLDKITTLCREKGMPLIEDCAHALYSSCKGRMLGTFGDLAVFSLQKTIPLPNGGGLLINNPELCDPLPGAPCNDKVLWKIAARSMLDFQADKTGVMAVIARAILTLYGNLVKDNVTAMPLRTTNTLEGNEEPDYYHVAHQDYGKGIFPFASKLLKPSFWQDIVQQRRDNYVALEKELSVFSVFSPLFETLPEGCCPLCFPVRVNDNDLWAAKLREHGVFPFIFGRFSYSIPEQKRFIRATCFNDRLLGFPVHQQLNQNDTYEMINRIKFVQ